jgi:DNA-binding HxlR family transcriptional regulator
MLKNTYEGQACSIARSLELIGERWTLLIVRDVFRGLRRFDDMQKSLGIARNVLANRLERLLDEDILEKRPYQEHPPRYEYFLTEKGIDLWPVLVSLIKWGDKYEPFGGFDGLPPVVIRHKKCKGEVDEHFACTECGERVWARDCYVERRVPLRAAA